MIDGKPNMQHRYTPKKWRGFTTLTTVIIVMLVMTLVTLYTVNTGVFEQAVSGNQYRAEQSLAAAQAGLDAAIDYYNRFDEGAAPLTPGIIAGTLANSFYSVRFCRIFDVGLTDPANQISPLNCPDLTSFSDRSQIGDLGLIGIVSEGFSDDNSGRRVITQLAGGAPILKSGGGPFQPILARGSVSLTGNVTVINRYHNSTVWSGQPAGTGSNSVESYINDGTLNPLIATRAQLANLTYPSPPNALLASKADLGINSDVRDNDQMLRNLTPKQLFEAFFANSQAATRSIANSAGQLYTNISSAASKSGLIWVEGSASYGPFGSNVGTLAKPAIFVVDGNLTLNGGTIYGLLFVIGNVQLGGNVQISGGIITTGLVDKSGGNPVVVYDPEAFADKPEGMTGFRTLQAGTWKDWQ